LEILTNLGDVELIEMFNPLVYFLRMLKLFKSDECLFLNIQEALLNENLDKLFSILKASEIQTFFNKNYYLFEELLQAFLMNSYGNKIFTKLLFIFTMEGFEKKIIK
jgi:hypothetical protein